MTPCTTNRTLFRVQLLTLITLALWRIAICFREYDAGAFVSVPRALLDQAPFWALLMLMGAGYLGWQRAARPAGQLLLVASSILGITTADLILFNGTARESLYAGSWTGEAHIAFGEEKPWAERPPMTVTFTPDRQVIMVLGNLGTPIHQGEWDLAFDPIRCSQSLTLPKFGRGDYWNKEDLHIRGSFRLGERSYQLSAHLRQTRKGPA